MRIAELAREVRLLTSAIRYYEREGLVPDARRTDSGYRLYKGEALARLRVHPPGENAGNFP